MKTKLTLFVAVLAVALLGMGCVAPVETMIEVLLPETKNAYTQQPSLAGRTASPEAATIEKTSETAISEPKKALATLSAIDPNASVGKMPAGQGVVAHVDKSLGFIVVNFARSSLPPAEQKFLVYRGEQQVGEVITTAQTDETFLVADINNGDIRIGDLIRRR